MKKSYIFYIMLSAILFTNQSFSFETEAKNAILMDASTGEYLFVKNHDQMIPPASMSKLMTIYLLFDALKKGDVSLEDTFDVSENAWKKGGVASGSSTMFLNVGDKVKVEDLIRGIIIQSGNDACITVAENLSGSETAFVEDMNKKAEELHLENSHFANATGWPHPEHRMSVEDLAKLAMLIINDFPEFYHIFSQQEFTYNGIKQWNRNPLLYTMKNADGLKTGHTEEAGFSLVASAKYKDRRLIEVMAGMKSNKERSEEANNLMNYGFYEFDNYEIANASDALDNIAVWYGEEKEVPVGVSKTIIKTMKKNKSKTIKIKLSYDTPIVAPIAKGDKVGELIVEYNKNIEKYPLVAQKSVNKIGMLEKFLTNVKYIIFGDK